MKQPTTINLVFTIDREDGQISRECERQWLEESFDSDGEYLSLHDNRFIISSQHYYIPDLFRKKIYLKYEIKVEAEEDDDNFTPEDLRSYIYKNISLWLPSGLIVKYTDVTIPKTQPNPIQYPPMSDKQARHILAQASSARRRIADTLERWASVDPIRSAQIERWASDLARHADAIRLASGITAANLAANQTNPSTR